MSKWRLTYFLVHRADGALHLSVQRSDGENIGSPIQQVADLVGRETGTQFLCFGLQDWKAQNKNCNPFIFLVKMKSGDDAMIL